MESQNNDMNSQMQKYSQTHSEKKLTKASSSANDKKSQVLELAKSIISGQSKVSFLEMSITMKENLNSPAIMSVFSDQNAEIGLSVCEIFVTRFVDSFGFATKMNATQLDTLVLDTFDNFRGESLGDIILFFKMARNGSFGTTHRGIDSNLIFGDWFLKFLELKADEREKVYIKEKSSKLKEEISIEDVHKAYEKSKIKVSYRDKVLAFIEKITDGITRTELESIITEWSADTEKSKFLPELKLKRLTIK